MAANEATKGNLLSLPKRLAKEEELLFLTIAERIRPIPGVPQPVYKTILQVASFLKNMCRERIHMPALERSPPSRSVDE
jgi:hypothetical protein